MGYSRTIERYEIAGGMCDSGSTNLWGTRVITMSSFLFDMLLSSIVKQRRDSVNKEHCVNIVRRQTNVW